MRISEAAKLSGLGIDTIRYYERSGLIPVVARGADGRRCFSSENIDWLVLLASLRSTGMPMARMRFFAALYQEGDITIPARRDILLEHQQRLDLRRTELDQCAELGRRHDIIAVGRSSGDIQIDMADRSSVDAMYEKVGPVDAVVSTAGDVHFGALEGFSAETFMIGLQNKVMGQINLVLSGMPRLGDAGSFTLTSGVLDRDPIRMGAGAAAANGALGGFVVGAAIEMPRRQRINVVSPGLLDVSVPRYGAWFPGHKPVSSTDVGLAYAKSVEGASTGQVIIVS